VILFPKSGLRKVVSEFGCHRGCVDETAHSVKSLKNPGNFVIGIMVLEF
jgi:hypothetical protein